MLQQPHNETEMMAVSSEDKNSLVSTLAETQKNPYDPLKEHFNTLKEFIKGGLCSDFAQYIYLNQLDIFSLKSFDDETLLHAAVQSSNELLVGDLIDMVIVLRSHYDDK